MFYINSSVVLYKTNPEVLAMMKKLTLALILCILLSMCAFALDDTSHGVNITYDETSGIYKAELSVSAGNAIVGHFGLSYNTEKLTAVDKDFAVIPDAVPEKTSDGKSYLTQVVKPLADYIVVTPESNKPAELIDKQKGYVLFGWYATKDVEAVIPTKDGGKIAELYFKLKEGVNASDVSSSDFSPVTADKCATLSGWNKGIIVINSQNKVFTYRPSDGSAELNISVKFGSSTVTEDTTTETEDDKKTETEVETESDTETENKTEVEQTPEESFKENGEVKTADLKVTVKAFADKVRIFWTAPDGVSPVQYKVKLADSNGNTIREFDGLIGITKSLTVKNLVPDFAFSINVSAFDKDGTELKHKESVSAKTVISSNAELTVYNVTYSVGEGSFYGFESEQIIFGSIPTKAPKVYAPEGYAFEGWTIDGENVIELSSYNVYGNTEFIAKYVKN